MTGNVMKRQLNASVYLVSLTDCLYRVDAPRTQTSDGSGLDLAIAKTIIQDHGKPPKKSEIRQFCAFFALVSGVPTS
jgi:signal transduction histidine kinase